MNEEPPTQDAAPEDVQTTTMLFIGGSLAAVAFIAVTILITNFSGDTSRSVTTDEPAKQTLDVSVFENVAIEGKAAYVYDVRTGQVLFAYNEEAQLPLASLTKLMTAVVATEAIPYDSVLTVASMDLAEEGDSGLHPDERWKVADLLDYTLMVSSNDGAHVLANAAGAYGEPYAELSPRQHFVALMNRKAADIGLQQTYYLNETGLDSTLHISGGYGSAKDMASLMAYAIRKVPRSIEATREAHKTFSSLDNIEHKAVNTNLIIPSIPGLIASKTGYTDLAGGNLVIAFDAGIERPIVISVLGSTEAGRFSDVEKLMAATFEALQGGKPQAAYDN